MTNTAHISRSQEILLRLTRCTFAQPRTNNSPFLKSYLHKVEAKSHPSPLCPLCNTHTYNAYHLSKCTHMRTTLSTLDLWTCPAGVTGQLNSGTEKLAGGPRAERSDSPHQQGSREWVDLYNNHLTRAITNRSITFETPEIGRCVLSWESVYSWPFSM